MPRPGTCAKCGSTNVVPLPARTDEDAKVYGVDCLTCTKVSVWPGDYSS